MQNTWFSVELQLISTYFYHHELSQVLKMCRHSYASGQNCRLLRGESQHVICERRTQSSLQNLLSLGYVESWIYHFGGAWNTNQHLQTQLFARWKTEFVWNSRKTLICVSKGSLPGFIRMIVGGVGLTTVDPTEEKWSGQTLGGTMTCWTLVLIF